MMNVWLLAIDHRHGADCWAFRSEEGAQAKLLRYVKEWWHELPGNDLFSDFPEATQAIAYYFDNIGGESYTLQQAALED